MDLRRINKQIEKLASQLPTDLCKVAPNMLFNEQSIAMLQQGIMLSANLIEEVNTVIKLLAEEVQNLRDEVAESKGEQGKPLIRPQTKLKADDSTDDDTNNDQSDDGSTDNNADSTSDGQADDSPSDTQSNNSPDDNNSSGDIAQDLATNTNISSEDERKEDKDPKTKRTNAEIKLTRTEKLFLNKNDLPFDAEFKGYQSYTIQNIIFAADNVLFEREVYYSPSNNRSYVADLPIGWNNGGYGDALRAFVISQHHEYKMSQPEIHKMLTHAGILISRSSISRMLLDNLDIFHEEKSDLVFTGLMASIYAHIDDTSGRVNGRNHYVHILCSEYFTSYFTREHKDRMTILEILGQGIVKHVFDESTYQLMLEIGVSEKIITQLQPLLPQESLTSELISLLDKIFPNSYATTKKHIIESSAIVAYQQLPQAIQILVCDDAPQFKQITELLALCWVHVARHYKKLIPIVPEHKQLTEAFISDLWEYYRELRAFTKSPNEEMKQWLLSEFDLLFDTDTGYTELDARIAKTRSQKDQLLVALNYPETPLHNNPAELGARSQARRRDISFQTRNQRGTEAKDTFMSIFSTARQLCVNAVDYITDRISGAMKMPSLAQIIENRANEAYMAQYSHFFDICEVNTT